MHAGDTCQRWCQTTVLYTGRTILEGGGRAQKGKAFRGHVWCRANVAFDAKTCAQDKAVLTLECGGLCSFRGEWA